MIEVTFVLEKIRELIEEDENTNINIGSESLLIGGDPNMDSMNLVQLCLALEEKAMEMGFEFDWTSEKAMSELNSIFKTPATLTSEFNRQFKKSLK